MTYGKPLNQIAELKTDDAIVVRVTDEEKDFDVWYVYKVTDSQIVTPDKIETIARCRTSRVSRPRPRTAGSP